MITTKPKSIDKVVFIATASSSITSSLTGIGLVPIAISKSIACGIMNVYKVKFEVIMQKNYKYKKQSEEDQQSTRSFRELYRKSSLNNLIDKIEYESLYVFNKNC